MTTPLTAHCIKLKNACSIFTRNFTSQSKTQVHLSKTKMMVAPEGKKEKKYPWDLQVKAVKRSKIFKNSI